MKPWQAGRDRQEAIWLDNTCGFFLISGGFGLVLTGYHITVLLRSIITLPGEGSQQPVKKLGPIDQAG